MDKLRFYVVCFISIITSSQSAALADTAYDASLPLRLSFQTAHVTGSAWERFQNAGVEALNRRSFDEAEKQLLKAAKSAKRSGSSSPQLVETRLALSKVYISKSDMGEARHLLDFCALKSKKYFGADALQFAQALDGLAKVNLLVKNYEQAEEYAKQSLAVKEKLLGTNHPGYACSLLMLANIMTGQAVYTDPQPLYMRALSIFKQHPGFNKLDYADALSDMGNFCQVRGRKADAKKYFDLSYRLKASAACLDQPSTLKGLVQLPWEEGSPQAEIIPDIDFPLKYMCVNNVRVACTVVDLWELMGILISITNIGSDKAEIGLGQVTVERPEIFERKARYLEYVDPHTIDRIRRERVMWDLTQNRPWLANMQKTRSVRGLVPAHGHDLFRGPNIFGVYRDWNVSQRIVPERFAINASPERVQYQTEEGADVDVIHTANRNIPGLYPVSLEPFESRTGVLFYLNPRCEQIVLKVTVGNAVFEFPFSCRKRRIN